MSVLKIYKTDTVRRIMQSFLGHLALLKLVRIVDERNYDDITRIRTSFWEKRKGETNGQTEDWRNE
jgi:hypothetical protein